MAIAEQLVIKARLDLSGVAGDIAKLRSQLDSTIGKFKPPEINFKIASAIADLEKFKAIANSIKLPVFGVGGTDSSKLAEAALKKLQLEVEALEQKKAQSAANELARIAAIAAKQEANSAKLLSQLEKQKAASGVRAADGGDKEAARIAQETLRFKQQIAAIDAKLINPADIANAKALATEINKLNLDKIKKGFDDASPVTFNQFIGATTEKARDLAEQLQNTSQTLERIGTSFNQVSAAAGEAFLGFDTAKTKVATLSNQSDAFANTAVKLSGDLRNQVTSTEILTAQYEILSSGFTNAADASEIARVSVIGAKAGFTDTATVADATTSILNAYGLAASDAANVVDQLAVVQDKGKTTIGQFAGQLGKVAPIAASAGVSLTELNAAVASVTIKGIKTETAVSGIRQAIVNLVKPTQAAQKELEKIGITNADTTLKTEGLTGVFNRLKAAGVTSSSQLSRIFTDIDGLTAVVPLLSDGLANFNSNLLAVGNAAGKADAGFQTVADSAQGRITEALNKVSEALVNIGRGASVAFAPLISAIGNLVDIFNSLPAPIQTVVGGAIGLTGAVFTLGAALAAAGAAAPAFVGGLKLFGFEAGKATIASVALTTATGTVTAANTLLTTNLSASAIGMGVKATATGAATLALKGFSVASLTAKNAVVALLSPLGLAAIAAAALVAGAKPLADAFNVSSSVKSIEELENKLKSLRAERGKTESVEVKDDRLGAKQGSFVNPFDTRLSEQKEVIKFSEAQGRYNKILDQSKDLLSEYGLASAEAGDRARLGAKGILEFSNKVDDQKQEIDATIESLKAQSEQAGDNPALRNQLNTEIAIFVRRKKLLDDRVAFLRDATSKETSIIEEATKEQREKAARILETRSQDSERGIKRNIDDSKSKREIENAKILADIQEKSDLKKAALSRQQTLETESLKERQNAIVQDRQRAFDDTQGAKKLALEKSIEDRKLKFDAQQQASQRDFENKQNKAKEAFAASQRAEDEKFAKARSERDKLNETATSGAKQAIADEAKIGTASPEDKAKIASQIAEEQRIRTAAASQGQGGVQSQDQLIAKAKQIAQVQAIATQEEQTKVQLALDELITANKVKQAEIDAAEDAKKQAARQAADKAFDEQQKLAKQAFDDQQKVSALAFENDILKPQKLAVEKELEAQKLAFERGELAELKKTQAAEERALKLQQETEDLAFKKKAEVELDKIKQEQKAKEVELDRKFEDEKIERERAFKESQRALDKASAIEIQAILGKSAQQIIDAIAITKGGTAISSALGVGGGKIPAFANGGVSSGGIALVGERGAELVNLPRGASVTPAMETRSLLSKSGDNSRIEALLSQLIGSVSRPNLEIKTTDDAAKIAADIYRNQAIADSRRSGL